MNVTESEAPATISVVAPTRNRRDLVGRLLASLERQNVQDVDIVVVDDASIDGTAEILEEWKGPGRLSLRQELPAGSYAARNRGWRASNGSIVAFTDDDCVPNRDWLQELRRSFADPEVVAVQGTTVTDRLSVTPFTHQIEQLKPGPPYRTCNMAYRRAALEQLGGFDENLRWYADNILGLRARSVGKIAFAPAAVVHHPPRPREWRDRVIWRQRFQADRIHREVLRNLGEERIAPAGLSLPIVLWVVRPLVKQGPQHVRYALGHPLAYSKALRPMFKEKVELLLALAQWRSSGEKIRLTGATQAPAFELPELPTNPSVSVVVVTRNRPQLLGQALEALNRQPYPASKVIVVDNGTDDVTRSVVEGHGGRYLAAPDQPLGCARQLGLEAAAGEIVAFTDDDCVPDSDWVDAMINAFRLHPEWAGVQGRTRAEEGPLEGRLLEVKGPDRLFRTCNIAYRREVLRAAGGFDRGFQGSFEDTALGARVLKLGPIGYDGSVRVLHQTSPREPYDRVRWERVLEDERRLASCYGEFYRRYRGPSFLLTVTARWLVGSPAKELVGKFPRAVRVPRAYAGLLLIVMREQWELLRALAALYRRKDEGRPGRRPSVRDAEITRTGGRTRGAP